MPEVFGRTEVREQRGWRPVPVSARDEVSGKALQESSTPFTEARRWLYGHALPFWAEHGVDYERGGFVEELRLDGSQSHVSFKRVRVLCRQTYVFSHAALLGFSDGIDLAWHGYSYLKKNAWLGPDRGWARLLTNDGCVKDATPDLYDLAFALFALGWFYRVSGHEEARALSLQTLDFLERHMRHESGSGFLAQKPAEGPRLQNPHMHLLEAALVNLEATGDARFKDIADELFELFCLKLFDAASNTLTEYFTEEWTPLPGEPGQWTEPGHQFEWAWILASYQRLAGRDLSDFIRALVRSAEMYGVDPVSGRTFNAVRKDGQVIDAGSRVWPNTERIQAAVALFEIEGRNPLPVFSQSVRALMKHYLSHEPAGTWLDAVSGNGTPVSTAIPASTLYHVMIAFTEMLRVEDAVEEMLRTRTPVHRGVMRA